MGFADGEGCFIVVTNETYVTLTFVIELHRDDIDILYKIVKNLGIGRVIKSKNRNSARFYVNKFYDIVKVIIPIFQEFTLQTTKYLDFICFLKVALIKLNVSPSFSGSILSILEKREGRFSQLSKTDIIEINKLKKTMNSGRLNIDEKQEETLRRKVSININ